ncbi:hypothetical protein G9U51_12310 [Calidifontibacter sp. DB0510]|uniref:Uncharacterized protein n=1 Tax=Metallococcus carri TaxID=1656884 RepID=A0A967B2X2_9MICO|nr:hypothetical protein [Metallococcus carri]NHN56563.1 hypothetical protein [Metallococcus carri]NOP38862.1 hypothetical protein [Calidifontibacter sp. DB2511S]
MGERSARRERREQALAARRNRAGMAIAAAVVVVGAGAGVAWATMRDGGGTDATRTTVQGTAGDGGGGAAGDSSSADGNASTDTTSSGTASSDGASSDSANATTAATGTAACVARIKAGEAVAATLVPITTHWNQHTSAQRGVNAGTMPVAKAKATWAASKKNGDQEVAAYRTAQTAYDKTPNGCASQDIPQACRDRASKVAGVLTAGQPIAADWSSHLGAMKTKEHAEFGSYLKSWMSLVNRAPGRLASYDKAAAALKSAPSCTA